MRTTIELNDDLLRQAKRLAADRGVPLRQVVETALRNHVTGQRASSEPYSLRWNVERGRLLPGACDLWTADRDFARFSSVRVVNPFLSE